MIIPIKKIILEASKLDKVVKKHIKNNKIEKAFNLMGKAHVNQNLNLKLPRDFYLEPKYKAPALNLGAATKTILSPETTDSSKKDALEIYRRGSRIFKQELLKKTPPDLKKRIENNKNRKIFETKERGELPSKYESPKLVDFNHGGGKHYLEGLLSGNKLYTGYSLEKDPSKLGIQVHPDIKNNSASYRAHTFYPKSALNGYGDIPAVLTGEIPGNKMKQADNSYEAGIMRKDLIKYGQNLKIKNIEFHPEREDSLSNMDVSTKFRNIKSAGERNKRIKYEDMR